MVIRHTEDLHAFILPYRDGLRSHGHKACGGPGLADGIGPCGDPFQEQRLRAVELNIPGPPTALLYKIRAGSDGYPVTESLFRGVIRTDHG